MIEKRAKHYGEERRALYSPDERYRYLLEISWPAGKGFCQWIMLNPSTATELQDDHTIRRCKKYAERWGFEGVIVTNVSAFRSVLPQDMFAAADPVGAENTPTWLASLNANLVIAGWGNWGTHRSLQAQIRGIHEIFGDKLHALGVTNTKHPAHPLYLKKEIDPQPFSTLVR